MTASCLNESIPLSVWGTQPPTQSLHSLGWFILIFLRVSLFWIGVHVCWIIVYRPWVIFFWTLYFILLFLPLGFERHCRRRECSFVLVIHLRGYLDNGFLTRRCLWVVGFFAKSFIPIVINLWCITVKISPLVSFEMSLGVCHPNTSCCQKNP